MFKRFLILLFLLLSITCTGMAEQVPTRVMLVTDVHYLSPSLYEGSDFFLQALARGDGKATMHSGELLQGLVEEARHQQPDVLVLSGDLTFNGEKQSHEEFASAMRALANEGIPVLVIPGNHDINSLTTVRYLENGYEFVPNTSSEDFRSIWSGMLATEMPGKGFSGVYRLKDKLWLVIGDYSVYENGIAAYGYATDEHIQWMTQVTAAAKEAGATLISVSHQALTPHMDYAADSFRVQRGDILIDLLADAGCKLNLSGHIHMQHILEHEQITDIATGAWTVSACSYGMISIAEDGAITYDGSTICSEHLPDGLVEKVSDYFRQVAMDKERPELVNLALDADIVEEMLEYAINLNQYYFDGTITEHPELATHPARQYWQNEGAVTYFGYYLNSLPLEDITDARHWQSK